MIESDRAKTSAGRPTLHLMVGLPCAGKTTRAKQLEQELPALRLNLDAWHIQLFGQDADAPEHDARHSQIEAMLWPIASRTLELGISVILDYGLWAREEREDYRARARALGVTSQIHYLEVAEEALLDRLRKRNAEAPPESFIIDEASLISWFAMFEAPGPDELQPR